MDSGVQWWGLKRRTSESEDTAATHTASGICAADYGDTVAGHVSVRIKAQVSKLHEHLHACISHAEPHFYLRNFF